MDFGFFKIGALSPRTCVADPVQNTAHALAALRQAHRQGVQLAVLPELFLSGYTCGDLFGQDALLDSCERALLELARQTQELDMAIVAGVPLRAKGFLYNCAAVLHRGRILGIVPKTYLPNYQEFYEKRWFVSGTQNRAETLRLAGMEIPFGNLLFRLGERAVLGIEICEDLWVPLPPSTQMALAGANVIVNLSASNEAVSKNDYRRTMLAQQSAKALCAYAYASAGVGESTTDLVFSGACTIAENGTILADAPRFQQEGSAAIACVDLERLLSQRRQNGSFPDNASLVPPPDYRVIDTPVGALKQEQIDRPFDRHPFVPD
ncbi:MAG TPA: NAD(+) synthase, partial [Candidatus Fimivicinus intestinavium]|nr:NAD(+) synthase [Candidatus Fimivicinus intestinavium]